MSGARNSPFGVRTKLMLFYLPLSSRLRRRSSEGGLLGSDKSFGGELRQAPLRLGATGLGRERERAAACANCEAESGAGFKDKHVRFILKFLIRNIIEYS